MYNVLLNYLPLIYITIISLKTVDLPPQATDTLSAKTSPPESDPVLKELNNPFYGYGKHEQPEATAAEAMYSEVPNRSEPGVELKEVANPTYGLQEHDRPTAEDPVSNPLYGFGTTQQQNGGVESSSSGLYSEVPASREVPIYEAPACD